MFSHNLYFGQKRAAGMVLVWHSVNFFLKSAKFKAFDLVYRTILVQESSYVGK